jgi:8-oxo-dGTP pyrophosphatase MutT (NUDIX family)
MNAFITDSFLQQLRGHKTISAAEETYRLDTISFVEHHLLTWWQRGNLVGHVTAAAWLVNTQHTQALLLHHAKLDRWLQPGGHIDDTDASPADGALREAMEETRLPELSLADLNLFDVDVHTIPQRPDKAAHLHYDVRYLVVAKNSDVTIGNESLGFRWIALDEIANSNIDESIARLAKKTLLLERNK